MVLRLKVKVGSFRSDPRPSNCGVPQGSVLGPITFNMYTRPLEKIVKRHKLLYHKYADDMQVYGEFDPSSPADCLRIKRQLEACLADIRIWMLKHMLKINDSKTELIIFVNPQQAKFLVDSPVSSVTLADSTIESTPTVRNLGVVMDSHLGGGAQVSAIAKSCNYHLHRIARIRHYISDDACKLAVLALVVSRLDYCNGMLAASTESQLDKLQRIQNRDAGWWPDHEQHLGRSCTLHLSSTNCTGSQLDSGLPTNCVCLSTPVCMVMVPPTSKN